MADNLARQLSEDDQKYLSDQAKKFQKPKKSAKIIEPAQWKRNLNQQKRQDQKASTEPEIAQQHQKGAQMPVSRSGGFGGGVQPEESTTTKKADTGMPTAGRAEKTAGAETQPANQAVKPAAEAAEAGTGGASDGADGGMAGKSAKASARAATGSKINQSTSPTVAKGAQTTGQEARGTDRQEKGFGAELKRDQRKLRDAKQKGSLTGMVMQALTAPSKEFFAGLLKAAWINIPNPVFLLTTWWYIALHFILTYVIPDLFCKFGEEWVPAKARKTAEAAGGSAVKGASKLAEIIEIMGCILIGLIWLLVILLIIVQLSVLAWIASNQWEAVQLIFGGGIKGTWEAIKFWWVS